MQAIELGNNGYASLGRIIGNDADLAQALTDAGYVVLYLPNLHGRLEYKGFTQRAQECLKAEPFGVSTYQAPSQTLGRPDVDYEGLILARQERAVMDY
jgi:hypothetical protein